MLRTPGRSGTTFFPWEPGQGHHCKVWRGKRWQVPTLVPLDNRSQLLASAGFHLVRTFNLGRAFFYIPWQAVCWLSVPGGGLQHIARVFGLKVAEADVCDGILNVSKDAHCSLPGPVHRLPGANCSEPPLLAVGTAPCKLVLLQRACQEPHIRSLAATKS